MRVRVRCVYLFELLDAVEAAEAFLLAVHQHCVVGGGAAGQVVAALLAAIHDEAVGHAVHVEAGVAADLVGHRLKAHLVPDLGTPNTPGVNVTARPGRREGSRQGVRSLRWSIRWLDVNTGADFGTEWT